MSGGGVGLRWIGWDGSEWNLRSGPVRVTKGGVLGLNNLEAEVFTRTTALVDGQTFTGWKAKPRKVLLPVMIGDATGTDVDWVDLDRAWWKTMQPNKYGRLIATAPDGSSRYLTARFVNDGDQAFETDPTRSRLSVAVIELSADDPWWKGLPFDQAFAAGGDNVNYYGGASGGGFGPPYYIAKGSSLGDARVNNPGDVDAWPIYRVDGPATSFNASIEGHPVAGAIELAADQQLVVNTSPDRQTAYLMTGGRVIDGVRVDGVRTNVTKLLAAIEFRPLPSGSTAQLNVSILGTGRITLAGDPRYFRGW